MEDRNYIHHEGDALDRELNALVREMEQEEVIRRAVIDMLVMLGSDEMLEHDVSRRRLSRSRSDGSARITTRHSRSRSMV